MCVFEEFGEESLKSDLGWGGGSFVLYSIDWHFLSHPDYILLSLYSFDRDWKKIEAFIGSKTVIQVSSCAFTFSC